MQNTNTQYTNAVSAAIQSFARTIANVAHDSVDSIQFLYSNYTKYDNVNCLANAALRSNLDTVVRENIHAQLV